MSKRPVRTGDFVRHVKVDFGEVIISISHDPINSSKCVLDLCCPEDIAWGGSIDLLRDELTELINALVEVEAEVMQFG